jgi:hypothetical protein
MSTANANNPATPRGFDSPVASRKDDHLNRWPLAREIYGIAATGPKTWSVRVGIYGEWGTGKTSVLRFVESMASQAGHIVVWFDPWEYTSKPELWKNFVLFVYRELEAKLGKLRKADDARFKSEMGTFKEIIASVIGRVTGEKAVDAGLALLREHFAFGPKDLNLRTILEDRRVIVLIDDLDRTAPELVPEILFALKELMDIPAFSFICAFDPIVVGEVLGKYHPGFGEGLKFLDKIIDYPRWLPQPSAEDLANLALNDAKTYCPHVPVAALREAIPLLPSNPRAVRQFIRLFALLEPQIERYYQHELHWTAIVAANILKIRHPRIAQALLDDDTFWGTLTGVEPGVRGDVDQEKLDKIIHRSVDETLERIGSRIEPAQRAELDTAIKALCSSINPLATGCGKPVSSQFNIAEAPASVTQREFDAFLSRWETDQTKKTAEEWIEHHAQQLEHHKSDVYRELLALVVRRYADVLHKADRVFLDGQTSASLCKVDTLFALLECLVFEVARAVRINDTELELIVETFVRMAGATLPVHAQFKERNMAFLPKFFEQWESDVLPLVRILGPYSGSKLDIFDAKQSTRQLHKRLCDVVLPKLACQIIASFEHEGFVKRLLNKEAGYPDALTLISDPTSPFWRQYLSETLQMLAKAGTILSVQENTYEFLSWLVTIGGKDGPKPINSLLSDKQIFEALWKAATASPLAPHAVYQLHACGRFESTLLQLGIKCEFPPYWQKTLSTFTIPAQAPATPPASAPNPAAPEEETT